MEFILSQKATGHCFLWGIGVLPLGYYLWGFAFGVLQVV
jgi:hypothetical protein